MGNICDTSNSKIIIQKREKISNRNIYNSNNNNEAIKNEKEIRGFPNIGNSCYINSFLQILFHCPGFFEEIKKERDDYLINALINLKNDPSNEYIYLKSIKNYMSKVNSIYGTYEQGDSQIFGKYLIDEIIKCLKKQYSLISYCDMESDTKENKYNKFIDINEIGLEKMFLINEIQYKYNPDTINISFNNTLDIEVFFPNNNEKKYSLNYLLNLKYNHKTINKNNFQFEKKICKLPKILIITISRSILNHQLNKSKLEYPETLDMKNYVEYIENKSFKKWDNTNYKLFAINFKIGNSQYNGHYCSFIMVNNNWYLFDDKRVIKEKPDFVSENVVGLFYINQYIQ